jgi:hypothetical protein
MQLLMQRPDCRLMEDAALGKSRAERAGFKKGVTTKKTPSSKRSRVNEFRNTNVGMFAGPRPTYGRYNVSEQASDVLNKSLNKKTR